MKKLFISYSDLDRNKMIALRKAIDKKSPEITAVVIADQKKPLETLSEKVIDGISKCDILIPILTANSIKNQWVNQEIGYAKAKDKKIIPIISNSVFKKLKGFINPQVDCPFQFIPDKFANKESAAFRRAYLQLLNHIISYSVHPNENTILDSEITPLKIPKGTNYKTKVNFRGIVKNGFFDNYVKHIGSDFYRWNVDKETLPATKPTDPGTLHGSVEINKEYYNSTKDWPIGRYKIYVRIYDHLTPGETARIIVAENIHEIEIVWLIAQDEILLIHTF